MASITKIASGPHMLRYSVDDSAGGALSKTLAQLIADCDSGPLKQFLTGKTATWGAVGTDPAATATHPMRDKRFTVIATPLRRNTGGSNYNDASLNVTFGDTGSSGGTANNHMDVAGGPANTVTAGLAHDTFGVVELRFNHSAVV